MSHDIPTVYMTKEDNAPRKLTEEEKRVANEYLMSNTGASSFDRIWGLASVITAMLNTPTTAKSPLEPSPSKVAV